MNTIGYSPYSETFSRNIILSLILHGSVIILLTVKAFLAPSEPIQIRNSIRVDIVGLPDKAKQIAPPAPTAKPEPVVTPAPPKEVKVAPPTPKVEKLDLSKAKSVQERALERLKAMEAVERMKSELQAEQQAAKKAEQAASFKGNVLNEGDSLTGLEKIDFDRYFSGVESKIRSSWQLPGWLSNANLRAQARVLIDSSGQVIKREIISSSGNEVFDAEVLSAIDRSSPFPEPPDRLKNVLASRGIIFNFPE